MTYPFLPINPNCSNVVINDPCGCSSVINNSGCNNNNPCSTVLTASSTIIYNGPALSCTTAEPCDTLNVILQKIDSIICNLLSQINALNVQVANITAQVININSDLIILSNRLDQCCPTTTTTTTITPTTTSTTSLTPVTTTTTTSPTTTTTSTLTPVTTTTTTSTLIPVTTTTTTSTLPVTTTTTTTFVPGTTTTTTTAITAPCTLYTIYIDPVDISNSLTSLVNLNYTNCNNEPTILSLPAGTYTNAACVAAGTTPILSYPTNAGEAISFMSAAANDGIECIEQGFFAT